MTQSPLLRFAVMVPGNTLKAWQVAVLRSLLTRGDAQLVLVIEDSSGADKPQLRSKLRKYAGQQACYHWYERFFLNISALKPESAADLLDGIERIDCRARRVGKYTDIIPEEVLERIRDLQPDFILRFAFNILKGEVLEIPTYGVWSYHHADEQVFRGGPAGFWEVYHRHDKIGVILQRLNERIDGGTVLKKGWYKVSKHSYPETLDRILNGSVDWPAQICAEIRQKTLDPQSLNPSNSQAVMNRLPGNWTMLRFLLQSFSRRLQFYFNAYLQVEEWNVGLISQPLKKVIADGFSEEPRWLFKTGRQWFAADPALARTTDGKPWVLFEEYRHRRGIGEIHLAAINPAPDQVLSEPLIRSTGNHLAFPRIFAFGGKFMLSLESASKGNLSVYELNVGSKPVCLEEKVLMDSIPAIDASLLENEGRWYAFCTLKESDSNTCLHIFYADSPLGPWNAHAMNPVKTDISSARMGGPVLRMEGDLIRPAQDSSSIYGRSIRIHRIAELSPTRFAETQTAELKPQKNWKYNIGMHTIDGDATLTLIDAKRYRFSLRPLWNRIFRSK